MENNFTITNNLVKSQITNFVKPSLFVGAMYLLAYPLLFISVLYFLNAIIAASIVAITIMLYELQCNSRDLKSALELDLKVKKYGEILSEVEKNDLLASRILVAKENELNYLEMDRLNRINDKCGLTEKEGLEQIKKINEINLSEIFRTLDIVEGKQMAYDKKENILYMTLKEFGKLDYSITIIDKMLLSIIEGSVAKENIDELFVREATSLIALEIYIIVTARY